MHLPAARGVRRRGCQALTAIDRGRGPAGHRQPSKTLPGQAVSCGRTASESSILVSASTTDLREVSSAISCRDRRFAVPGRNLHIRKSRAMPRRRSVLTGIGAARPMISSPSGTGRSFGSDGPCATSGSCAVRLTESRRSRPVGAPPRMDELDLRPRDLAAVTYLLDHVADRRPSEAAARRRWTRYVPCAVALEYPAAPGASLPSLNRGTRSEGNGNRFATIAIGPDSAGPAAPSTAGLSWLMTMGWRTARNRARGPLPVHPSKAPAREAPPHVADGWSGRHLSAARTKVRGNHGACPEGHRPCRDRPARAKPLRDSAGRLPCIQCARLGA